jgi:quinolinate synthase
MLLWPGVCIVHEAFSETELLKLKGAAPECAGRRPPGMPAGHHRPRGLCRLDQRHPAIRADFPGDTLIVATEPHIIHQMQRAVPDKHFIGAPGADGNCSCNICPYMALNTLEKLYVALRDLQPQIHVEENIRVAAKRSLDRMLQMASGTIGLGDLGRI